MRMTTVSAGLLHDVGKFSQRVRNEQRWKHEEFTEAFLRAFTEQLGEDSEKIITLAAAHHRAIADREGLIVKVADFLASAERRREVQPQIAPEKAALLALTSQVQLDKDPASLTFFPLRSFSLDESIFFPMPEKRTVDPDDYRKTWDEFAKTLHQLPQNLPLLVWQNLLFTYTHAIPSATPWEKEPEKRTTPDISLFHHAKLTAAIAACLVAFDDAGLSTDDLLHLRDLLSQFEDPDFAERLSQDQLASGKALCFLVRGDVAGIQNWLYRIARAEGEAHRRTAKRLRGRSFYLVLLTEAIAYWLCRQAQMPPCNILFCGGGVFDVLLPATEQVKSQLPEWAKQLDEWLLEKFYGDLGVNIAWVEITAADFYDFGNVYLRIATELEKRKQHTFATMVGKPDFWFREVADICRFCDTTPFARADEPCEQCKLQESLGDALKEVGERDYIVWAISNAQKALATERGEQIVRFEALDCSVAIVSEETAREIVKRWDGSGELIIRKRNDPKDWHQPLLWDSSKPVQAGIWWVATDAPVAKRDWRCPTKPADDPDATVREGEGLDFDEIAALSDGDDLIGVLKMDVDHLGTIFAVGVQPPSPSRIAELSGRMDAFFSAWLQNRCRLLTKEWQEQLPDDDERKGLVDNAFYILYAGGDDLMIIGPWNLTLVLAQCIRDDLTRYCGDNPNMTISAGIIFVKPKFPIHRFSVLAGEALEQSKDGGRNRITAFNATVSWDAYKQALDFGKELAQAIESKEMPRTFVHFLWHLYRTHVKEEKVNPLWAPLLHYMVARRLEEETIERLKLLERIPQLISERALPIALGYAILATRERARVAVGERLP